MKKSFMNNMMSTVVDTTIGSAVIGAVGNSNMPQSIKDVTTIGVSAAVAGRAIKRFSGGKSKWY